MMTLEADRAVALDAGARAFMATFIAHVTTLAGDDQSHLATIARTKVLLLAALGGGDAAASAWNLLYRTVAEIVPKKNSARHKRAAYAYLQSFVRENRDLARD